jgi:hypothetical protein
MAGSTAAMAGTDAANAEPASPGERAAADAHPHAVYETATEGEPAKPATEGEPPTEGEPAKPAEQPTAGEPAKAAEQPKQPAGGGPTAPSKPPAEAGQGEPAGQAEAVEKTKVMAPPGPVGKARPEPHPVTRRLSMRSPVGAARRVAGWSRRPGGRLVLSSLLLVVLMAGAVVAGVVLVPASAQRRPSAGGSVDPGATPTASAPVSTPPSLTPSPGTSGLPGAPVPAGRPADVLIRWAEDMSAKVSVPSIALQAYGYAELVLSQTTPACNLKWTTLAAIGKVESDHGSANNSSLLADGRALPSILGSPLDGKGGRAKITDTDGGVLDGDRKWDRAVGPMQFIPGTWNGHKADADNDGNADPNDIDDAALAAANYLCRGGRNLSDIADWWSAILTYNDVQPYAQQVYQTANDYGTRSRT